jgi:hypothetical protein
MEFAQIANIHQRPFFPPQCHTADDEKHHRESRQGIDSGKDSQQKNKHEERPPA